MPWEHLTAPVAVLDWVGSHMLGKAPRLSKEKANNDRETIGSVKTILNATDTLKNNKIFILEINARNKCVWTWTYEWALKTCLPRPCEMTNEINYQ